MKTEAIGRCLVPQYLMQAQKPFIWVSIREPEDADPNEFYRDIIIPDTCKDVLTLEFSDLISPDWSEAAILRMEQEYAPKWRRFTYNMQTTLDSFVTKYRNQVDVCMFNCYAGVSRSAALGAYVGRKTGESDWFEKYYQTKGKFPCFYICRMLELPIPSLTIE